MTSVQILVKDIEQSGELGAQLAQLDTGRVATQPVQQFLHDPGTDHVEGLDARGVDDPDRTRRSRQRIELAGEPANAARRPRTR
ncbi:hypothetical protein MNZ22_04410 [Aeromonas encheleia]|nr:hypothetical protein [Aeromonas encheleia]UNP89625.1 hypothetical protein MNZ22_04410 [Aeromonas encheleia]